MARGAAKPAPELRLSELDQRLTAFLLDTYHQRVHGEIGLVLIGMPGIERRLSRYAQFYGKQMPRVAAGRFGAGRHSAAM
jgi:hypothetical protein